jgi:hypothetical protein
MDAMVIGIDVSKDRLDVAVRPTGESLIFKRTGFALSGERKGSRMRVKPTAIWGMSVIWILTLA